MAVGGKNFISVLCLLAWVAGGWAAGGGSPLEAAESRKVEKMIEATGEDGGGDGARREREARQRRGRRLFLRFCAPCHGAAGRGDGDAAHYLYPRPRDLGSGIFKFHTTQANALPRDRDLLRTLRRGLPGTAMPAWGGVLPEEDLEALVAHLKTFSARFDMEIPDQPLEEGLEPPFDEFSIRQGGVLYRQLRCASCHGAEGRRTGRLKESLKDVWDQPAYVFDLTQPDRYKAGADGDAIYNTLMTGIGGTSMNPYDYLTNAERWHLVHYLQSRLQEPERSPGAAAAPGPVRAAFVDGAVPLDPDHPAWRQASPATVDLTPLQAADRGVHSLRVRALHNGRTLGLRVEWDDATQNSAAPGPSPYLDGAALQFPLAGVGKKREAFPFFGMGARRRPVNIWHWRAAAPDAGWVDPFRESEIEELNAQGLGSLTVQVLEDQQVEGRGRWREGRWQVVLRRSLKTPSPLDIQFTPEGSTLIAFALWDGARRDKNAQKVISVWKNFLLD